MKFRILRLVVLGLLVSMTSLLPLFSPIAEKVQAQPYRFAIDNSAGTYTDDEYNFSFSYPSGWQATVPLTASANLDPIVIRRRIALTSTANQLSQIRVDVWKNTNSLQLQEWFDRYERPLHPIDATVNSSSDIMIAGVPGMLVYEPADQRAYGRVSAVTMFQNVIIRVDY